MTKYWVADKEKPFEVYLIKEGYIPSEDYKKCDGNSFYGPYSLEDYCLTIEKEDLFDDYRSALPRSRELLEEYINKEKDYLFKKINELMNYYGKQKALLSDENLCNK